MAKKEKFDLDKEVERLSRKTNVNIRKTEYAFNNQIKKLDKEIDEAISEKINLYDDNKQSTQDYLEIEFKHDTINRYREKLKKI
ncbi:hypothetical protein [Methanobrevibacter sp.]